MLEILELRYFKLCSALIGVQAPVLSTMNGFSVMQLFISVNISIYEHY